MKTAALAVMLATLLPFVLSAQTTSSQNTQPASPSAGSSQPAQPSTPPTGQPASGSGSGGAAAQPGTPQPVPYAPDEFPLWLRQLRRAEIISIGAFPIALLVTSLSYQTVRYAQHGYSQAYAPALFGSGATPLTNQEKVGILLGGVGVSVAVALADFIIGKLSKPKKSGTQQ